MVPQPLFWRINPHLSSFLTPFVSGFLGTPFKGYLACGTFPISLILVQLQKTPQHTFCFFFTIKSSWWLNQPLWKLWSSNWKSSPSRGKNKKYLKPPLRNVFFAPEKINWFNMWILQKKGQGLEVSGRELIIIMVPPLPQCHSIYPENSKRAVWRILRNPPLSHTIHGKMVYVPTFRWFCMENV